MVLIDWNAETETGLAIARIIIVAKMAVATTKMVLLLLLLLLTLRHCEDAEEGDGDDESVLDPPVDPARRRIPVFLTRGDIDDADFIVAVISLVLLCCVQAWKVQQINPTMWCNWKQSR